MRIGGEMPKRLAVFVVLAAKFSGVRPQWRYRGRLYRPAARQSWWERCLRISAPSRWSLEGAAALSGLDLMTRSAFGCGLREARRFAISPIHSGQRLAKTNRVAGET